MLQFQFYSMELELPNTLEYFTKLKSIIQEVEIEIYFMQNLERKTFYATKSLGSHINSVFQKHIACINYNTFYSNKSHLQLSTLHILDQGQGQC